MRAASGPARAVVVRLCVSGAFALAGCSDPVSAQVRADAVRDNLRGQGVTPDAVHCSPAEADDASAICTAEIGEDSVRFTVQRGADGDALQVRPLDPAVVVADIVPQIRRQLADAGIEVVDIACDGAVWVARAGARRHCRLTDRAGRALDYEASFSGNGSDHTMRVSAVGEGHGSAVR